jgi:6-methylsalicylate decarboxylase
MVRRLSAAVRHAASSDLLVSGERHGPGTLSRRSLLQAGSALVALATAPRGLLALPSPTDPTIDIHHHYLPPFYRERAVKWLKANASTSDAILGWTPERALQVLDEAGIATAVLSITTPGFAFGDGKPMGSLPRQCNEYAARLVSDHKGRFRFLTALPMPDVPAALREVEHGSDVLGASGVGLMSNYGGRYLGDPQFAPLFDELNRRHALVHVHPTDAPCCKGLVADVPTPILEFAMDTGRTVSSLLWSGTFSRCPDIRFVFSHGGGILPMVMPRIVGYGSHDPKLLERVPEGPAAALAKLYVDTASIVDKPAFGAAHSWLGADRILFGSDYPWGNPAALLQAFNALGLSDEAAVKIRSRNVLTLLGSVA